MSMKLKKDMYKYTQPKQYVFFLNLLTGIVIFRLINLVGNPSNWWKPWSLVSALDGQIVIMDTCQAGQFLALTTECEVSLWDREEMIGFTPQLELPS